MSRFCGEINTAPILEAARRWRDVAFLADGSVFSDKNLWTIEGLEALVKYFVQNPDAGTGNYIEKLREQLAPTPRQSNSWQLMNWFMLLCPSTPLPRRSARS